MNGEDAHFSRLTQPIIQQLFPEARHKNNNRWRLKDAKLFHLPMA